jgi:ArsR family transcriptional regulator
MAIYVLDLAIYIDFCQYDTMECTCGDTVDPIDADHAEHIARVLKALADPSRLRIVSIIARAGDVCVCDLTTPLGLSQPTVSHHVKVLREAGVLVGERRGKWVHVRLADEPPAAAAAVLDSMTLPV